MVVNNELSCVLSVPVEQPPADGWSLIAAMLRQ